MQIEFDPKDVFSFEKVISPVTIKLLFFAGMIVFAWDAIAGFMKAYTKASDAFLSIPYTFIGRGIMLFIGCQILLALVQKCKCASEQKPEPPQA